MEKQPALEEGKDGSACCDPTCCTPESDVMAASSSCGGDVEESLNALDGTVMSAFARATKPARA